MNYEKKAVEKVLELTSQGWKRSEITTELGISYSTVKRYQSPDFSPVHGLYYTTRERKLIKEAKCGSAESVEKIERKWNLLLHSEF